LGRAVRCKSSPQQLAADKQHRIAALGFTLPSLTRGAGRNLFTFCYILFSLRLRLWLTPKKLK